MFKLSQQTEDESQETLGRTPLDMTSLPPVYALSAHMTTDELVAFEHLLGRCKAPLTYDPSEARIFLGKVAQRRRIIIELLQVKVKSEEVVADVVQMPHDSEPSRKRQRMMEPGRLQESVLLDDSSTNSERDDDKKQTNYMKSTSNTPKAAVTPKTTPAILEALQDDQFVVIKMAWFDDSIAAEQLLPFDKYIVYKGRRIGPTRKPQSTTAPPISKNLVRARAYPGPARGEPAPASAVSLHPSKLTTSCQRVPALIHQTTSEHDIGASEALPPLPEWAARRSTYSCERATPSDPPNAAFVAQLIIIRKARKLMGDEIGVRAYSTSIASIAAYPYTITSPREILALPGCEGKMAALWSEWRSKNQPGSTSSRASTPTNAACTALKVTSKTARLISGQVLVDAARVVQNDPKLAIIRLFYDIWGVGAKTARDFYDKGWRDIDDVIENGWDQLSRDQQIGIKYYDEFLLKISRKEVEAIAALVHAAARKVAKDPKGVKSVIVGGYRRGKKESGDVDVIVSHQDKSETIGLVQRIVGVLMDQGWITHELISYHSGSRRGQATLPFRIDGGGHGFDTLDKAFLVWQDPNHPCRDEFDSLSKKEKRKKNPNPHRRVDIIIAPWNKIGCAVLGWTAGTTFERDLRRYAKNEKGWKFDSSGVRDRANGKEVDLEGFCESAEEAERKVFEGLGLVYREPWERCTN